MTYTDAGLWINDVSGNACISIKRAVFAFRAKCGLDDGTWHVRAYGVLGSSIDVWVGEPPNPNLRKRRSIEDNEEAGEKVAAVLEELYLANSKEVLR